MTVLSTLQRDQCLTVLQTISGFVAAKGDFKGEKQETEDAKKQALTGADIVIIPAGVPRSYISHLVDCQTLIWAVQESLA